MNMDPMPSGPAKKLGFHSPYVQLNIAILLFGLAAFLTSEVNADASIIALSRYGISFAVLLIYLVIKRQGLRLKTPKEYGVIATTGILLAIHGYSFIESIRLSGVAAAVILFFAIMPISAAAIKASIDRQLPNNKDILTLILLVLGVLISDSFGILFFEGGLIGLFWGVLSGATYALRVVIVKKYFDSGKIVNPSSDEVRVFFEHGIAAIAIFIVIGLPFTNLAFDVSLGFTINDALLLLLLGLGSTAIANVLLFKSMRNPYIDENTVSAYSGLELIYSILITAIVTRELPLDTQVFGASLIILAILVKYGLFDERYKRPVL